MMRKMAYNNSFILTDLSCRIHNLRRNWNYPLFAHVISIQMNYLTTEWNAMILSFLIHLTSALKKKTQKFVCYTVCDPIGTYGLIWCLYPVIYKYLQYLPDFTNTKSRSSKQIRGMLETTEQISNGKDARLSPFSVSSHELSSTPPHLNCGKFTSALLSTASCNF